MTEIDQRYLVQQRKINPSEKDVPVFAKAMRSKSGLFEGVSFIRNKEKASVMTLEQAQEVIDWIQRKKTQTGLYLTTIICKGQ
ncbi:MAG: hypothetical protein ABI575_02785 [Oxalobacteraceae bacterium]